MLCRYHMLTMKRCFCQSVVNELLCKCIFTFFISLMKLCVISIGSWKNIHIFLNSTDIIKKKYAKWVPCIKTVPCLFNNILKKPITPSKLVLSIWHSNMHIIYTYVFKNSHWNGMRNCKNNLFYVWNINKGK